MPRGDKTGPRGNGSMTGRKMGYCSDNNHSELGNQGFGFRRAMGNGHRQGNRNFSRGQFSDSSVNVNLENEIANLKEQLASIEKKLFNQKDD